MPKLKYILLHCFCLIIIFSSCSDDENSPELTLENIFIGNIEIIPGQPNENIPVDRSINLIFSNSIDATTIESAVSLTTNGSQVAFNYNVGSQGSNVNITPVGALENNQTYSLNINSNLRGSQGQSIESVTVEFKTLMGNIEITEVFFGSQDGTSGGTIKNIPLNLNASINFSDPVNPSEFESSVNLSGPSSPALTFNYSNNDQTVMITTSSKLRYLNRYNFTIESGNLGSQGEPFEGYNVIVDTKVDSTLKYPEISEEELLTKVQAQTFKYFWDFGHPNSGLARERNTSGDLVTIGGSGFGVMSILAGINRGFITRQEGITRLGKIVDFLSTADRFHGVWPHWMNGITGNTIPFSSNDDGGDIVETAFMIQGLLTVRQYLDPQNPDEKSIIDKITLLWEEVEWDWYTQGENSITWHWSPNYDFEKNLKVRGWNEALIVYVLAASSPTHSVTEEVYHEGWARSGGIVNGNTYFNIILPLGNQLGGPLFFEHYSFLGLDPRNLTDQYADYNEQTIAHTLINRAYCISNPKNFVGYSQQSWGLTASDNHLGYSAHSPTNDLGVITPTAALSSIPYTPQESMEVLKYFYFILGDRLWGEYGFYDAFNFTENWVASSYLAIDQGPIIVMIENHRSQMLWNLFMTDQDIQNGLNKLGFNY
ncbi:Ig-like domain-containing protein [Mangrovivirga sp. M17]|uniref:Ig-like domain-containing protein n=1 Tax=Mangrovivirga halotolerans TaxID=2993936 RepID=A0ABT3RL36_9BACT|nr:glucoamylase family protein [Mangrovivirga halotolerans]MCX2742291.1 Ig-like domain-containing protein [Mangrovivirga halotolerans]